MFCLSKEKISHFSFSLSHTLVVYLSQFQIAPHEPLCISLNILELLFSKWLIGSHLLLQLLLGRITSFLFLQIFFYFSVSHTFKPYISLN